MTRQFLIDEIGRLRGVKEEEFIISCRADTPVPQENRRFSHFISRSFDLLVILPVQIYVGNLEFTLTFKFWTTLTSVIEVYLLFLLCQAFINSVLLLSFPYFLGIGLRNFYFSHINDRAECIVELSSIVSVHSNVGVHIFLLYQHGLYCKCYIKYISLCDVQ